MTTTQREELMQAILWVRSAERNLGKAMNEGAGIRALCIEQLDKAANDLDTLIDAIAPVKLPTRSELLGAMNGPNGWGKGLRIPSEDRIVDILIAAGFATENDEPSDVMLDHNDPAVNQAYVKGLLDDHERMVVVPLADDEAKAEGLPSPWHSWEDPSTGKRVPEGESPPAAVSEREELRSLMARIKSSPDPEHMEQTLLTAGFRRQPTVPTMTASECEKVIGNSLKNHSHYPISDQLIMASGTLVGYQIIPDPPVAEPEPFYRDRLQEIADYTRGFNDGKNAAVQMGKGERR